MNKHKIYLTLLMLVGSIGILLAQTNTFPSSGNAGIGTTNPSDKLDIRGSGSLYSRIQSTTDNQSGQRYMTASHSWISGLHGGESGKYKISYNTTFGTNDFLTIRNNGNVGIGTVDPTNKLQVEGQTRLNPGGVNNNYIQFQSNNTNQVNMLFYTNDTARWNMYAQDDGRLIFRKTDNNPDGGIKMVIEGDYVGIGTENPGRTLDVAGEIRSIQGSDRMSMLVDEANNISEINWGDDSNDRLRFLYNHWNGTANDKEVMTLLSDGKVGIGTATPDTELAVNGNIHAKEVKVDLVGWPDYVFEEDYDLPTLEEVQDHINEKGHLINMPSASEVESDGLELGEMNRLLLEKIEEMTLYILQLREENKKIVVLEKRLQKLESKLSKTKL